MNLQCAANYSVRESLKFQISSFVFFVPFVVASLRTYAARSLEKSCDFLETVQVGLELLVGIGTRDRIGVGI